MRHAVLAVTKAHRPVAVENDAGRLGIRFHAQVLPPARRLEIGHRRTVAPPVAREQLKITDAFLIAAVEVMGAGNAELLGAANDGLHQFASFPRCPSTIADHRRHGFCCATAVVFGPDEIGQHALPVPAGIAELRPVIVILALAANENQPVDRTRSAKSPAARPVDLAIVHVDLGVGVETPIVGLVKHGLAISDRDMDPEVVVPGTGLEQQDLMAAIRAEAIGQDAARRSRAHDDVIEFWKRQCRFPPS